MVFAMPALRALVCALAVAAGAAAGCGGSGQDEAPKPSRPATQAFPAPDSPRLAQLLAARGSRPQLAPGVCALERGSNRFAFGLFDASGRQLRAPAAVYLAPASGGAARGPFPAVLESMAVQPRFASRTTVQDSHVAGWVQVAHITLAPGPSPVAFAVARTARGLVASRPTRLQICPSQPVEVGAPAPRVHTPTVASVNGDLSRIETRIPPDDMHTTDFADVVGRKPVVLTFATPALCQSRVCGPILDEMVQLQSELGDRATFIHMEVYRDNRVENGLRPQLTSFGLRSEPWVFAIDRRGKVAARIEGAASIRELRQAVERALR